MAMSRHGKQLANPWWGKGLWELHGWVYLNVNYGVMQANELAFFRKEQRVFWLPLSKLVDPTLCVTIHRKVSTHVLLIAFQDKSQQEDALWTGWQFWPFESTAGLLMAEPAPQGKHTAWVYLSRINFWGWTFQTLGNSCLIQRHNVVRNFYTALSLERNALTSQIILPQKIIPSKPHHQMQPHYYFWICLKKHKNQHSRLEIYFLLLQKISDAFLLLKRKRKYVYYSLNVTMMIMYLFYLNHLGLLVNFPQAETSKWSFMWLVGMVVHCQQAGKILRENQADTIHRRATRYLHWIVLSFQNCCHM